MDCTKILENLKKRKFTPKYFEDIKSAIDFILEIIPNKDSIGFGGSMTVTEIGLLPKLFERGNTLYHSDYVNNISKEELRLQMHTANWYISSTNALSTTGELINIDGRGNRVAEMVNGPENIIIIAGTNKIVNSIEEGIYRTRNVASPLNCIRLNRNTPCAKTGKCSYCNTLDTICNATVIQHHPMMGQKNVYIIIIDKKLGY